MQYLALLSQIRDVGNVGPIVLAVAFVVLIGCLLVHLKNAHNDNHRGKW